MRKAIGIILTCLVLWGGFLWWANHRGALEPIKRKQSGLVGMWENKADTTRRVEFTADGFLWYSVRMPYRVEAGRMVVHDQIENRDAKPAAFDVSQDGSQLVMGDDGDVKVFRRLR